ncbi:MAG: hypothetical protein V1772_13370, partial [Chloroflexota bacterium]
VVAVVAAVAWPGLRAAGIGQPAAVVSATGAAASAAVAAQIKGEMTMPQQHAVAEVQPSVADQSAVAAANAGAASAAPVVGDPGPGGPGGGPPTGGMPEMGGPAPSTSQTSARASAPSAARATYLDAVVELMAERAAPAVTSVAA